jgi:hypothetical protein
MRFDSWSLGYTAHNAALSVHYPSRQPDGTLSYGAGLPFDHRPEITRTPDSERAQLWKEMLADAQR